MARPNVRKDKKRGTWIVEYYDDQKKQHRLKGFKTKRDADARADEIGGEVRKGVHTPASQSETFGQACDVWIKRAEREKLEPETIRPYRNHVNLHLKPLTDDADEGEKPAWKIKLDDLKLADLNPPVANAVLRRLQERLSATMARKVWSSFKAILDEAVKHTMIAYNPAATIKWKRRDRGEHKVHAGVDFPDKAEMAAIITVMEGRWRALIIVLGFCGVRSSELRSLEWTDAMGLDTQFPKLRVRQRADNKGKIGDTKSHAAHRFIPLTPLAAAELREWRKICPRDPETGKLGLIFANGAGRIENHANISNRGWKEWQIKAGVCEPRRDNEDKIIRNKRGNPIMKAKYGVHALRHFFASLMVDQGFNPKHVQALMGHSTIQMTLNVYSHLFPSDDDYDRERFAKAEASVFMAAN